MSSSSQLQALQGKYVHYISNKGKSKIGLLHHFEFDRKRSSTVAVIMKSGASLTSPKMQRINLSQILPRSFQSSGSSSVAIKSSSRDSQNGFCYGGVNYHEGSHSEYKIGDEVVWLIQRDEGNSYRYPLIGKVRWIGIENYETARGAINYVAVVQFDEPTKHFPKHIPFPPTNRNIVDLKDLIHLKIWMDLQDSMTEDSTEQTQPSSSSIFSSNDTTDTKATTQNNLIDFFDDVPEPKNADTSLVSSSSVENIWQDWLRDIENTNKA